MKTIHAILDFLLTPSPSPFILWTFLFGLFLCHSRYLSDFNLYSNNAMYHHTSAALCGLQLFQGWKWNRVMLLLLQLFPDLDWLLRSIEIAESERLSCAALEFQRKQKYEQSVLKPFYLVLNCSLKVMGWCVDVLMKESKVVCFALSFVLIHHLIEFSKFRLNITVAQNQMI